MKQYGDYPPNMDMDDVTMFPCEKCKKMDCVCCEKCGFDMEVFCECV